MKQAPALQKERPIKYTNNKNPKTLFHFNKKM